MRVDRLVLASCLALAIPSLAAAQADLLTASKDAPMYQLSNLRTEVDPSGSQVTSFDFKRTRQGANSTLVSVQGRSARGALSIAAHIPSFTDSGTMQLKSLFPNRGSNQADVELFLVQTHDWGDGKVRHAVVSNSIRLGNPGPAIEPRAWTKEEEAAYESHKRIMADDLAQKPRKSYPVSIDVPKDSQFVPQDAKVAPGTPLEACYSGKWHPLTVLSENEDGSINVRWDTYGATYDCSMVRDELIVKTALLAKSPANGSLTTLSRSESEKRGLLAAPPKPRKSYPVSIAVPNHSQPVPKDLKMPPGTQLQACYAAKWNPITVLSENQDGSLNVRWDDYGPAYDCSMVRDELIVRKAVAQKLQTASDAAPSKPPELRTWTDATGKHAVRAMLVRKSDMNVTLRTEDGREVTLLISKLSEGDRDFLRSAAGAAQEPSAARP